MTNPYDAEPWKRKLSRAVVPAIVAPPPGVRDFRLTSGFVVEAGGQWFWITAEHSFEEIEAFQSAHPGSVVYLRPFFDDTKAGVAFGYTPENAKKLTREVQIALQRPVEDEGSRWLLDHFAGQDIGIYHLEDYYVRNLRSAGVVPFGEDDVWRADAAFQAEWRDRGDLRYYMCGTPANETVTDAQGLVEQWSLVTLRLGTKDLNRPRPAFEPWWSPSDHEGSLKGMSGGPVCAVVGDRVFWFGVQSSTFGAEGKVPKEVRVSMAVLIYPLLRELVRTQMPQTEEPDITQPS